MATRCRWPPENSCGNSAATSGRNPTSSSTSASEPGPASALPAFAAGADGVIVEVHPYPDKALSDGRQSLNLQLFSEMMRGLERYVPERAGEPALVA